MTDYTIWLSSITAAVICTFPLCPLQGARLYVFLSCIQTDEIFGTRKCALNCSVLFREMSNLCSKYEVHTVTPAFSRIHLRARAVLNHSTRLAGNQLSVQNHIRYDVLITCCHAEWYFTCFKLLRLASGLLQNLIATFHFPSTCYKRVISAHSLTIN